MTTCPHCGADSRRACDFEDEIGCCPFDEMGGWDQADDEPDDEIDPDRLREDRDERRRADRFFTHSEG